MKDDKKNKEEEKDLEDIHVIDEPVEAEASIEPENEEIDEVAQKLEEADNKYKRALADYQNLEKRVQDQRRDLIMSANRDLLLKILSVLDTLVLANQHNESEGLKVAISQFLDVLKVEGVTRIETIGKEFDPQFMEAIVADDSEDGKVTDEIQAGFMLNDKLLRPAQVKVGSVKQNKNKEE